MQIDQIILGKLLDNSAHNVYLVEPNSVDHHNEISKWLENLLSSYLIKANQQQSFSNHQDILFISDPEDSKKYLVDTIEEVIKFLNYSPIGLSRKVVVLKANYLSELTVNKLLKTLEEPDVNTSFFILNPLKTDLLSTLNSRSIKLRIKLADKNKDDELDLEEFKNMNFHDFSNYLTKNNVTIEQFIKAIYNAPKLQQKTASQIDLLFKSLETLKTMQSFNSSNNSKHYLLHQALTQLI